MNLALTPRQQDALRFLRRYYSETGYMPTLDAVRAELGLKSKSNVKRLMDCLEDRGAIKRMPRQARGIQLTQYTRDPGSVAEALDVAREHLIWALHNGMTAEQVLKAILGRHIPTHDLNLAILEVAKAWERLREGKGR